MNRENNFYNEFDLERLKKSPRENEFRTPFQIDRDRIIHSSEFRRLQGKTQVFLPGLSDFYRTRLTHSIEVAQIGRSICYFLKNSQRDIVNDEYYIDPDLVESACLSHDLGHPPFGHSGERTLNKLMKNYGGFEANAQTLRLISEIFYTSDKIRKGMNPTRAFLDSILKYKVLFGQMKNPENHFIYDLQKKYLDFVNLDFANGNHINKEKIIQFESGEKYANSHSIECQIMDWADDTAYAVNDIVDSIYVGFMTIARLARWQDSHKDSLTDNQNNYLQEIIQWIKSGQFKSKFGAQIGDFIHACSLVEQDNKMSKFTNRYKYNLKIDKQFREKAEFYKRISYDLVFQSAQLHQMEFKGNSMLTKIFEVLKENYVDRIKQGKLLPDFSDMIIRREPEKEVRMRLVCDYIAGMTDAFALRTYKRLFDPEFGSIVDLL